MLTVPVAGGQLAVADYGAFAPDAPTIVAVHGITANSHSWGRVARRLNRSVRLVAVDLRGRGDSRTAPPPYGLGQHAQDLLTVVDWLRLGQIHLAGHSLGAYIAARFAIEHNDRVVKLTLIDGGLPIPGIEQIDPNAFLGAAVARLDLTFASREQYREWWTRHPAFGDGQIEPEDLAHYADHDLTGDPPVMRSGIVRAAVAADAADLPAAGDFAYRLAVPTLLLTAPRGLQNELNPMQPEALARAWAEQAPAQRHARLVPNANHYTLVLGRGADHVAAALAR
jgi:pimeloyl-ACP methyl ester carboxylesterase